MKKQNYFKAALFLLLTVLGTSFMAAGAKYASSFASIHMIVAVQYGFGLVVLTPYFLRGGIKRLKTSHPGLHLLRGACGLLSFYTYYYAIQEISLLEASLLRNSAPLCLPLMAMVCMRERISGQRWLALIIGFIGVAVILHPAPGALDAWYLAALVSAIFVALSMLTTRLLVETETPKAVMFYYFFMAVPCSLPGAIINYEPLSLYQWVVLVLVALSFYLALSLYTRSFQYAKATALAPFIYFGVVFAGILGWIFWHQVPEPITYAGVVLVIGGALISARIDTGRGV